MANILVVDDDPTLLKIVEAALLKAGHAVVLAEDGYSAIDKLQNEIFDLVISDVKMPNGLSGFDLISTLKKDSRWNKIPTMLLTGLREKKDVERALRSGTDDYLIKPPDHDILLAKVESLLSKKNEHSFKDTPIKSEGFWPISFDLIGISEQGMTFISPIAVPPNQKLKIESDLFSEIGISVPTLRISSCANQDPNNRTSFIIKAIFVGLTESEHQKIRRWVMSNSPRIYKAS